MGLSNKEYKFIFIYKLTNLINGKIYIGKHMTNNMDDHYMGSGHAIKEAVREFGKLNFKKEIIEHCSKFDLNEREKFWILYYDSVNTGYNAAVSSSGGYINEESYSRYSKEYKGRKNSKEQIIKVIESKRKNGTLEHREDTKERIRKSCIETYKDPELRAKCGHKGESNPFYGKKHSDEVRSKMSEISRNRPRFPCKYCGRMVTAQSNKQFHLDKCKSNPNNNGKLQ